jgi:sterol-4alpha-carboxylate 3-dehydrogenase (decarboxylating)
MANSAERIFITGGAGFVGRAIISRLQTTHPDWILFSYDIVHTPDITKPHNPSFDHSKVTWLTGDITSYESVEVALSKASPTVVIHTAGVVPPLAERYGRRLQNYVFRTNITGTEVLLKASKATTSVRAFVWTGSCCAVIDDVRYLYPCINESWKTSTRNSTIYGESKARAELLVLADNDPKPTSGERKGKPFLTTALRPSVLFGPEDYQLIPSIHACIAKNEIPFIIGSGLNMWDVTDVRNVAHAHVLAVENLLSSNPTAAGEAIFFGNGCPLPFRDFCREIWKQWDVYPSWEVHIPEGIARFVAGISDWVGWLLGKQTTLTRGSVSDAVAIRYVDEEKAKKILGYKPIIGLEEGIRESCQCYKQRLQRAKLSKEHE